MQKFTIFSLLLSISIILVIGDIVFHDYLKADTFAQATSTAVSMDLSPADTGPGTRLEDPATAEPESTAPQESAPATTEPVSTTPQESVPVPAPEDTDVQLSEIAVIAPELDAQNFASVGFVDPVLKETTFTGNIFQLLAFSDQTDAFVYQSNLFEGERFIGSVYEIKYPSETGSFQGYLALRERAMIMNSMGEVNEANNYGDSSFYFNHKVKTKTVHLVIKKGATLYVFEYPYTEHERMKALFTQLP